MAPAYSGSVTTQDPNFQRLLTPGLITDEPVLAAFRALAHAGAGARATPR